MEEKSEKNMITISPNNIIKFVHGDTIDKAPIFIDCTNDETSTAFKYIVKENDRILFSILEANQDFNEGIIRKIFTKDDLDENGNLLLTLDSSDSLNVLSGTYSYSIKLVQIRDDKVIASTIITKTKLYILE